jgi:glycosyltransferase involved in cell wall biosynthesis
MAVAATAASARVAAAAAAVRPSLIHANSTTAALLALPAALLRRVPLVWHVRDLVPLGPMATVLGRASAAAIAVSNAVASSLPGALHRRVRVIYNPVARSAATRPPCPAREGVTIACLAQFTPRKRIQDVVRAAAAVVTAAPGCRFRVAGGDLFGAAAAYVASTKALAAALGLGDALRFEGFVADPDRLVAESDILVTAAEAEPFGRTVVEAMAAGRPVVATDVDGHRETVTHDTGVLVPVARPDLLARALRGLARDPALRARLGAAGRRRAEKLCDPAARARDVLDVYTRVLARAGRSTSCT